MIAKNSNLISIVMESEDGEKEEKEETKENPFCHTHLSGLNPLASMFYSISYTHSHSFLINPYHSLPETPPPNFS
jgi:hypothetical protein